MPNEYEVLIIEDNDQRHKHTVLPSELGHVKQVTDEAVKLAALRWFESHFGTSRATEAAVHITKRPS